MKQVFEVTIKISTDMKSGDQHYQLNSSAIVSQVRDCLKDFDAAKGIGCHGPTKIVSIAAQDIT